MSMNGRFVWFDLLTTDIEAAKAFYSEVVGWRTSRWEEGGYDLLHAGDKDIGGLMTLPEEARQAGAPPHWMGYVGCEDVDATLARAKNLGGSVILPGTDIPNIGRFAILADPQGATFAIYSSPRHGQAPDTHAVGRFGWAELNSTDWKAAWAFYSELFGWKELQSMDFGPEFGTYMLYGIGPEDRLGGMSDAAKMMNAPAHWLHYINVEDIDESIKRIEARGGKILNGPVEVPGGGRIVQCLDPQGAAFALFSP